MKESYKVFSSVTGPDNIIVQKKITALCFLLTLSETCVFDLVQVYYQ